MRLHLWLELKTFIKKSLQTPTSGCTIMRADRGGGLKPCCNCETDSRIQQWLQCERGDVGTSVVVFTADPHELGQFSEVCWLQDGKPATLAGVRPHTTPPVQSGPELVSVRYVVPIQSPMMVQSKW